MDALVIPPLPLRGLGLNRAVNYGEAKKKKMRRLGVLNGPSMFISLWIDPGILTSDPEPKPDNVLEITHCLCGEVVLQTAHHTSN